jgi:hypothetical protein
MDVIQKARELWGGEDCPRKKGDFTYSWLTTTTKGIRSQLTTPLVEGVVYIYDPQNHQMIKQRTNEKD